MTFFGTRCLGYETRKKKRKMGEWHLLKMENGKTWPKWKMVKIHQNGKLVKLHQNGKWVNFDKNGKWVKLDKMEGQIIEREYRDEKFIWRPQISEKWINRQHVTTRLYVWFLWIFRIHYWMLEPSNLGYNGVSNGELLRFKKYRSCWRGQGKKDV